jgi:hypothetical protein
VFVFLFKQEVDVKAGGGHVITIGEMVRQWLVKLEWYSTLFPRIPVPVQKDLDVKLKGRMAEKLQQQREEAPRHIADDEVNFGEAEKYASNKIARRRCVHYYNNISYNLYCVLLASQFTGGIEILCLHDIFIQC